MCIFSPRSCPSVILSFYEDFFGFSGNCSCAGMNDRSIKCLDPCGDRLNNESVPCTRSNNPSIPKL